MKIYDELTAITVTASPKDNDGDAFTPTTARYRIDDCRTGRELVDWTTLTPSTAMTIEIPGSVNAIINSDRQTPEQKVVTLNLDNGLSTQLFSQYFYGFKDLGFAQIV